MDYDQSATGARESLANSFDTRCERYQRGGATAERARTYTYRFFLSPSVCPFVGAKHTTSGPQKSRLPGTSGAREIVEQRSAKVAARKTRVPETFFSPLERRRSTPAIIALRGPRKNAGKASAPLFAHRRPRLYSRGICVGSRANGTNNYRREAPPRRREKEDFWE